MCNGVPLVWGSPRLTQIIFNCCKYEYIILSLLNMTYISLLSDLAVVISSVRGFILASVRLFLQMLNVKEYEDQSHFKSRNFTIVYIIQKDYRCDGGRFSSRRPQMLRAGLFCRPQYSEVTYIRSQDIITTCENARMSVP